MAPVDRNPERNKFDSELVSYEARNPIVYNAFLCVDRKDFVPEKYKDRAYFDEIFPLVDDTGIEVEGATISQPTLVVRMIDHLGPTEESKATGIVLQVGTGSGYDSAVLAQCYGEVCTIDSNKKLVKAARKRLKSLGYSNISVKTGDGSLGWEEKGPFDAIVVTAEVGDYPTKLIDQLKIGGRIVFPLLGSLVLGIKTNDGLDVREIGNVRFVPLIGKGPGAWNRQAIEALKDIKEDKYRQDIKEMFKRISNEAYNTTVENIVNLYRERFGYDISEEKLVEKAVFDFIKQR